MPQLVEGSPQYVSGSGAKPYELKNTGGVYSCSCPAWRNQSVPIERRTCKHLRGLLGSVAEDARCGGAAPRTKAQGATTLPAPPDGETAEDVLAAVFGQGAPSAKAAPNHEGKAITAEAGYAQQVLDRAAEQGRKLRQDEKAKLHGPPVLLAHPYDGEDVDPTGWWMSEKLDGVRAYWNGTDFVSRQGNVFHAPAWFKQGLPSHPLDGELWMGRQMFQKTISVVKRHDAGEQWRAVKYVVFDHPSHGGTYEERQEALHALWDSTRPPFMTVHSHSRVLSRPHLKQELDRMVALGAEGLMIRKPGALYEAGRSHTILKVKPFQDAEGTVVGHTPGKGRHKGVLGALVVRTASGKEFSVGTGLSDAERRSPPRIGATITYSFTELTNDGIPKCGAFVAVRDYE